MQLPIYPDNPRIPSGMEPEGGPLQLYNWAEYLNPAVVKSFEKKYGVGVELSTFSTVDEAIAKLASGAVGYDVFVPTQPYIALLVAGKIIQPLNLTYVPNLRREVWRSLQSPWYDVGSRYTVPYTIFSTGIAWRNDFLPDYDPSKLRQPVRELLAGDRHRRPGRDPRRPARRAGDGAAAQRRSPTSTPASEAPGAKPPATRSRN